jgi:ribose transport system ATP-binding protein
MLLPVLQDFVRWFRLDWSEMAGRATLLGKQYDVRPNRPAQTLASLSGGNAQKVLMAKWLQTAPLLLMLDEPTQGVDVGARQQLFAALDHAATDGTSILIASTDYEQLAQICDRVLIFARGQVVDVLEGAAVSKDAIAERCLLSVGSNAFSRTPEVVAV